MSMPFHCFDKYRNSFLEPLSTDPIGRFPQNRECWQNSFTVDPGPWCWFYRLIASAHGFTQGTNGVLAMKSCYLNKLIENLPLLDSCSRVIPLRDRLDQF